MVADRREEHKVSRIALALLACFAALSRCRVPAIAIDVLHVHCDGRKSRQIADELIDFVAEHLRRADANGSRSPWRVVAGGQRHVKKPLRRIAGHVRAGQGDDGVFEIAQVDHRHLWLRRTGRRILHPKLRDDLDEAIEQLAGVESGGALKVVPQPFFRDVQPEMRHANELMMNAVTGQRATIGRETREPDGRFYTRNAVELRL